MRLIRTIIRHLTPLRLLWFLVIVFAGYFTFVAFMRHDNFHSRRLDLGNMEQTVWNLAHGNGFTLTDPMGTDTISRLAVHADFLLILMVPFYLLWSDPKMLILVQTIVICLGSLPVFWIARDTLKSPWIALLFSLAYLLYPPLEHVMLHDFHAVALSTTFLLFAFYFMGKRQYIWFIFFAVLSGLGKEEVWMSVGFMGLYIAMWQRHVILGLSVAASSFFVFYYLFWHAIPSVAITHQHFALQYLSEFGSSESDVVMNILRRPDLVLMKLIEPDRLEYYYRLLLPVGFLPIFSPWSLLYSVHSILINTLSSNGMMRQIDYQYTSDITPFLFVSAIYGYKKLKSFIPKSRSLPIAFIVMMVIASYLWGEVVYARESRFFYFTWPMQEKAAMRKLEARMSSVYTISVTNNIGSHFAQRENLYNFPIHAMTADYAIARLGDQYAWPGDSAQRQVVSELLVSPEHRLIAQDGEFYAFEKISQ